MYYFVRNFTAANFLKLCPVVLKYFTKATFEKPAFRNAMSKIAMRYISERMLLIIDRRAILPILSYTQTLPTRKFDKIFSFLIVLIEMEHYYKIGLESMQTFY